MLLEHPHPLNFMHIYIPEYFSDPTLLSICTPQPKLRPSLAFAWTILWPPTQSLCLWSCSCASICIGYLWLHITLSQSLWLKTTVNTYLSQLLWVRNSGGSLAVQFCQGFSYEVVVRVLSGVAVFWKLDWGWRIHLRGGSHAWFTGMGCWWEASSFSLVVLPRKWLESPSGLAVHLPPEQVIQAEAVMPFMIWRQKSYIFMCTVFWWLCKICWPHRPWQSEGVESFVNLPQGIAALVSILWPRGLTPAPLTSTWPSQQPQSHKQI